KSAADSEWEDKGRDSTGKNGETQEVRIATEHLLNRPLQVLLQEQETGTWPFIFHPGLRAGAMLHCRKYITGHEREQQLVSKLHLTETQVTNGSRTGTTRKRGSNKAMP
ncbi:hypothetical protein GBAR_LOCUS16319, partial [Geodia barretti]